MDYRQEQIYTATDDKIILEKELLLIEKLKPEFFKEGNQYCFLYGSAREGIAGFGETVALAVTDFAKSYYNTKV